MENAAQALKIAFAIFVFVIAISLTFVSISRAREVADIILYSMDITNFYPEYDTNVGTRGTEQIIEVSNVNRPDEVIMELDENRNRLVGIDTIISMLYRYHKESLCIVIIDKGGAVVGRFDLNTEREAPWRSSRENSDKRIDLFLQGEDGEINGVNVVIGDGNGLSGQRNEDDGSYNISEQNFHTKYIANNPEAIFKEEFIEVPYSGEIINAVPGEESDGTEVIMATVARTVYITYTEI